MKHPAILYYRDDAQDAPGPGRARRCAQAVILGICVALAWTLSGPGRAAKADSCKTVGGESYSCEETIQVDDMPLYLLKGADPNFFMTLDTSSSMLRAGPEDASRDNRDARAVSSYTNPLYYNPEITYLPPKKPDGTSYDSASFAAAPADFFRNQFSDNCSEDGLKGSALENIDCAAVRQADTDCHHNLASEYAAVETDALDPCTKPYQRNIEGTLTWVWGGDAHYVRDPSASSIIKAPEWAALCMYPELLGRSKSEVTCPAYYYRFLADETYSVNGTPQPCKNGVPAWSASSDDAKPWVTKCLRRVIVGTTANSPDADVDGDTNNTSDKMLKDRKTRLTDCPSTGDADEQVKLAKCNFANWYSFYHSRWRTLQSVVTLALADLVPSARVGYQGFPAGETTEADYIKTQLLQPFGSAREDSRRPAWLQDWLFATRPSGTTPLIESALRILNFAASDSAYLMVPLAPVDSINNGIKNDLLLCRNNFHLLFTDGAWSPPSSENAWAWSIPSKENETPLGWVTKHVGNADDTAQPLPTNSALAQKLGINEYPINDLTRIFADHNSGGLADVVFYSWITDLRVGARDPDNDLVRTRLPSDFSTYNTAEKQAVYWSPDSDPADWQHIATYTVGFGLKGKVTKDLSPKPNERGFYDVTGAGNVTSQKNLVDHGFPSWDSPTDPAEKDKVDDLWHAGLNGRGDYWDANDSYALIDGFKKIVTVVNDMTDQTIAATTAPAINTGGAAAPRIVFQAVFWGNSDSEIDNKKWTGDLRAFRISGGLGLPPCADKNRPKGAFCDDPTPDPTDPDKTLEPPYWSAAEHLTRGAAPSGVKTKVFPNRTLLTGTRDESTKQPKGVKFEFAELYKADKSALLALLREVDVQGLTDDAKDAKATAIINYIAGSEDGEDGVYRKRTSVLGDIINSAPLVVSAPHRAYKATLSEGGSKSESGAIIGGYPQWAAKYANRKEIVYVGANDGMLHAFDTGKGTGAADDTDGGAELFAYVPRPLFPYLSRLTDPAYGTDPKHTSFVDGLLTEGDAFISKNWASVVVGALGLGAQAVFAIKSPDAPDQQLDPAAVHLWDFTDQDDPDMGNVLGKPAIARVYDGESTRWVAIFGNGVNSSKDDSENDGKRAAGCTDSEADQVGTTTCGQAVLYVVPLDNAGTTLQFAKFSTGVGRKDDPRHDGTPTHARQPNGLSQPTVLGRVLTDKDGKVIAGGELIATAAYAGDLFGNLWRFDLTKLGSNERTRTATLVFTATDQEATPNRQPITAPVALAPHPTGVGTIVLFGTGRYLGGEDRADSSVQSFYGIWDRVATADGSNRTTAIESSELQRQYFKKEYAVSSGSDSDSNATVSYGRTSTRVNLAWAADPAIVTGDERMGWRIDLGISSKEPAEVEAAALANKKIEIDKTGERVVVVPQLRGERVVFVSLVPEPNLCTGGGFGWVNTLAYANGSALNDTPFDYNQDGTFDSKDLLKSDSTTSETGEAGTSIRLADGGVYSATAALPIGAGESKVLASDSKGKLVALLESSAMRWRVWRQVR